MVLDGRLSGKGGRELGGRRLTIVKYPHTIIKSLKRLFPIYILEHLCNKCQVREGYMCMGC